MALRSLDRDILRLAVPALAQLTAEPLYILTDTAIVGHLGTNELAGLALASTILLSGFAVFIFLAYGTTAAVARLLGAGEHQRAAAQAAQGIWLALVLGVVTAAVIGVCSAPLVELLGGEGAVATNAVVYLRISLFGFPGLLAGLAGVGYLRGRQDTRTPLFVSVGSAAANLVLEAALIFGLGFGIGASALATVVAQWGAAGLYGFWVLRGARQLGVGIKPDLTAMRRLLVVGLHLLVRTVALRGSLVLGTAVAARIGTVQLAAYQIGFEVWSFLGLALDALAIAAQSLVGHALGAGDADAARQVGRRVNELSVAFGVVVGAAIVAARWPLAAVFSDDPDVVASAAWSLLLVGLAQPVNAWAFALDGTLIGAGDMRFLAWAMAGAFAVFAPAALTVAATGAGLGWLWAALILFMTARVVILQTRFVGEAWAVVGEVRAR